MSMGNDHTLSAEELAVAASTLVRVAKGQQYECDELLDQLKTALKQLEHGTTELTRNMPNKIAQQAAKEVVQTIADLVTQKVADVLQPAEAEARTLLRTMENTVAEYRRAARNAVLRCIIASVSAVLVVLAMMKMAGIVWTAAS
jgi:cytosine/adenosine deaminase-related metal-dependent hydrolase